MAVGRITPDPDDSSSEHSNDERSSRLREALDLSTNHTPLFCLFVCLMTILPLLLRPLIVVIAFARQNKKKNKARPLEVLSARGQHQGSSDRVSDGS